MLEIKSNTLGKLNKIREGTVFSDEYTFIKEFLQNSQRGKSKIVNIVIGDNYVSFEDDGIGCKDPESLFTLDKSEWITTDEGFGIGFWSCLALSDLKEVEVLSKKWKSTIDIENLFTKEDLSVPTQKLEESTKGFFVKLTSSSNFSDYKKSCIEDKVNEVAKYLKFDVYLNGELIEKADIFEDVYGEFIKVVDNRFFKARLTLDDYKYGSIKLFYDNRFVCKFYNVGYLDGVVELKRNKITLKEPDRTDYIYDEKLENFTEALKKEAKKIYIEFLKSNSSEEILEKYSDGIKKYLTVEEYEKYVFLGSDFIFKSDEEDKDEDNYESNDEELALSDDKDIEFESNDYSDISDNEASELNLEEKIDFNKEDFNKEDYKTIQTPINFTDKECDCFIQDTNLSISNLKSLKQIKNMVWIRQKEADSYSEEISLAKYCNLMVYKVKNALQEEVMKKYNKLHISDLKDSLVEEYDTKNIGLKNKKEESFIKLLAPIAEKFNIPLTTFNIANLSCITTLSVDGKIIYKKKEKNTKDTVYTHAVCTRDNILFDRNYLKLSRFNIKGDRLGVPELNLIMYVSKTVAHELAHYLYHTVDNTINHYKIEDKLYREIIDMYVINRDNVLSLISKYN